MAIWIGLGLGVGFALTWGMTAIAAIISSVFLLLGAVALLVESGYSFDLRRRSTRRIVGGRRASDRT